MIIFWRRTIKEIVCLSSIEETIWTEKQEIEVCPSAGTNLSSTTNPIVTGMRWRRAFEKSIGVNSIEEITIRTEKQELEVCPSTHANLSSTSKPIVSEILWRRAFEKSF